MVKSITIRQKEEENSTAKLARFLHDEACPMLSRAIHSWTWTDSFSGDDEPLGPPTTETLQGLDALTEVQYLIEAWLESVGGGEEEKN